MPITLKGDILKDFIINTYKSIQPDVIIKY